MRKEFKAKLNGDESRKDASAAFTLPFDTREVWGKAESQQPGTEEQSEIRQRHKDLTCRIVECD